MRVPWAMSRQRGAAASADPRQYGRAIHDKFLSYGGPLIPLVRNAMVGEAGSLF